MRRPIDANFFGIDAGSSSGTDDFIRIALLSPYSGANLGDGAIFDSILQNLRAIHPAISFISLTADPDEVRRRHSIPGITIVSSGNPFRAVTLFDDRSAPDPLASEKPGTTEHASESMPVQPANAGKSRAKSILLRTPIVGRVAKAIVRAARGLWRWRYEPMHLFYSLRLARDCDLILVCGGGQLDEQWGGPWHHPYALWRWALVAKLAGTPLAMASVGLGLLESRLGWRMIRATCSKASYRSYRDPETKSALASWVFTANDPCVPDLALGLPRSRPVDANSEARIIDVGISPMAFDQSGELASERRDLYDDYIQTLALFVVWLVRSGKSVGYFVSNSKDRSALKDLSRRIYSLEDGIISQGVRELRCETVTELTRSLSDVDLVVASRLHSVILAHWAARPALAISYERKVTAEMHAVGHDEFVISLEKLEIEGLKSAYLHLTAEARRLAKELSAYAESRAGEVNAQFDSILRIATRAREARRPLRGGAG